MALRGDNHEGEFVPDELDVAGGEDEEGVGCEGGEGEEGQGEVVEVQDDQVGCLLPLVDQDGRREEVQDVQGEGGRDHGAILVISL